MYILIIAKKGTVVGVHTQGESRRAKNGKNVGNTSRKATHDDNDSSTTTSQPGQLQQHSLRITLSMKI